MPFFAPPVVYENPAQAPGRGPGSHPLWRYYGPRAVGRTVLRVAGAYATYATPDLNTVASATEVYLGGHWYEISEMTAQALAGAGYTTYETRPAGSAHGHPIIPA